MKLLPKYYYQFYIGCINLYGVIDTDNAFVIFKKYYPSATKKEFLQDIRNRNGKYTKKYTIWTTRKKNLYLIVDDWYNEEDIDNILYIQSDKPFYIPNTIEEFINVSSFEYWNTTNSGPISTLSNILFEYNGHNKQIIIKTIFDWIRYLSIKPITNSLEEIINRLIRWGYVFNEEDFESIVELLQDIWNNTKLQCNRGYSPIELRELFETEDTNMEQC